MTRLELSERMVEAARLIKEEGYTQVAACKEVGANQSTLARYLKKKKLKTTNKKPRKAAAPMTVTELQLPNSNKTMIIVTEDSNLIASIMKGVLC